MIFAGAVYPVWVARTVVSATVAVQRFIFENPYFAVREIQVRGADKVRGNEIISMAGLRHGMNLWNIEPEKSRRRFQGILGCGRVLVRREFPAVLSSKWRSVDPRRSWRSANFTMSMLMEFSSKK